jgi:ATP-binding cassette subfamily C protein LapB
MSDAVSLDAPSGAAASAVTADPLKAGLRAILNWLERPVSEAALDSRVAQPAGQAWSLETLTEAADSLGLTASRHDFALPDLAPMPCLLWLKDGSVLAVLERVDEAQVRAVLPLVMDRPGRLQLSDLLAQVRGGQAAQALALVPRQASERARDGQPAMGSPEEAGHRAFDAGEGARHGHWFWGPLLRSGGVYGQVALAALLVNVFAIASSIFSMTVYDRVIPNNAMDTLMALLLGVTLIFACDFVIRSLRAYFLDMASARADAAMADALFEQVLDIKMKVRLGSTGNLASVLKEFESVREFLTSATLTAFIDLPFALIFLVVIYLIGGPIVWVPLVAIPVMILAALAVQPKLRALIKESQEGGHHKHAILVETLSGLETIKALGAGASMRRRWQEAVVHQSHVGLQTRMLSQLTGNIANAAQQFTQVLVVTAGAYLVQQGQMGFGAIIACTILAGRAVGPIAQVTQLITRLNQTLESYQALARFMKHEREHRQGQTFLERPHFKGAIEFRDVVFGYPKATRPVLDGVSFRIEPGERVAIVGKIGSGKTTVAKLILGLYTPDSGAVLIDGVDVRQIDPADLRRALGVVLQDAWLMAGTLRQNIALGSEFASDADVLQAASVAGVEDFVREIPEGYGLRIGERGEGLSGGQRQALAIARALVSRPRMLVFDEASSAMDSAAEEAFIARLRAHLSGQTLVMITHKSSVLSLASRLIVLDRGKVVAQGPTDQLLRPGAAAPAAAS